VTITYAAARALTRAQSRDRRRLADGLTLDLALNAAWTPLFFRARRPRAALAEIACLNIANVLLIRQTWRADRLPGINAESIDLTVEQNVLTVRAERAPVKADGAEMIVAERPSGTFTRQVFLGETLDAEHIAADYAAGVLTLTIPVREAAKPRNIHVTSSDTKQAVTA
jgi:Hsp20/alpha crystallin family/TspO/MBR family